MATFAWAQGRNDAHRRPHRQGARALARTRPGRAPHARSGLTAVAKCVCSPSMCLANAARPAATRRSVTQGERGGPDALRKCLTIAQRGLLPSGITTLDLKGLPDGTATGIEGSMHSSFDANAPPEHNGCCDLRERFSPEGPR